LAASSLIFPAPSSNTVRPLKWSKIFLANSTAAKLTETAALEMAVSAVIAVFSVVSGLVISYQFSTAASASIVVISVALFFVALTGSRIRDHFRRKTPALA